MKKVKIYWDLDGTLAKWKSATMDDLYKKDYFLTLDAENGLCRVANELGKREDVDSYILTSYLSDSRYAKDEKMEWTVRNVGNLSDAVIFVPYGSEKAAFVERLKHKKLNKSDVLIDDHSPNLIAWEKAGGTAVKWCNGINNTRKSLFSGLRIDRAAKLLDFIDRIVFA